MIQAGYSDKNSIVNILANAFDDNRSVNHIVKQDNHRKKRIRRLMEYSFDVCHHFGRVLLSDDKNACALVLFPDQKRTTLQSVFWDLKLIAGCISPGGIFKAMTREKKIRSHQPKERLYYLWFIGVHTDKQKQGSGSALLSEIIRDAEAEHRTLCLETSSVRNIPWYKNFGFEAYDELEIGCRLFFFRR